MTSDVQSFHAPGAEDLPVRGVVAEHRDLRETRRPARPP